MSYLNKLPDELYLHIFSYIRFDYVEEIKKLFTFKNPYERQAIQYEYNEVLDYYFNYFDPYTGRDGNDNLRFIKNYFRPFRMNDIYLNDKLIRWNKKRNSVLKKQNITCEMKLNMEAALRKNKFKSLLIHYEQIDMR